MKKRIKDMQEGEFFVLGDSLMEVDIQFSSCAGVNIHAPDGTIHGVILHENETEYEMTCGRLPDGHRILSGWELLRADDQVWGALHAWGIGPSEEHAGKTVAEYMESNESVVAVIRNTKKVRPFTFDEVVDLIGEHVFAADDTDVALLIVGVVGGESDTRILIGPFQITPEDFANDFVFDCGSPCGMIG